MMPAAAREIGMREAVETELLEQTRRLYWTGQYGDCVALCESGITAGRDYNFLRELLFRSLIAEGKDELAFANFEAIRKQEPENLSLLMTGYRLCGYLGKSEEAEAILKEVNRLARSIPRTSLSADDLVALGSAAFALGADPAKVLDNYFRGVISRRGCSRSRSGTLRWPRRSFAPGRRPIREIPICITGWRRLSSRATARSRENSSRRRSRSIRGMRRRCA
jgi:hypothetical protein